MRINLVNMSNNNIMVVGCGNTGSVTYCSIIDNQGNFVKSVMVSNTMKNPYILNMSNGNNIIIGNSGYAIVDNQGTILKKDTTKFVSSGLVVKLFEASNGNIFICDFMDATNFPGVYSVIEPKSTNANASLNSVPLDTVPQKDKFYELVYNEAQDKFIAEEVRNAN